MEFTQRQVDQMIKKHELWANKKRGVGGKRADFSHAKFNNICFTGADLRYADFSFSEFNNCWFIFANLSYCNFRCSDFNNCSFGDANMQYATLTGAYIGNCDFDQTNLAGAALNVRECDELVEELFIMAFKMDMLSRKTRKLYKSIEEIK